MKLVTEVSRLALAASVPAVLLAIFPYKAIGFKAAAGQGEARRGRCRFVKLTAEDERKALNAARASWATDASNLRRIRLELMESELPEYASGEMLGYEKRETKGETVRFTPEMLPESLGAGAPAEIKAEERKGGKEPAFPREELLKLP